MKLVISSMIRNLSRFATGVECVRVQLSRGRTQSQSRSDTAPMIDRVLSIFIARLFDVLAHMRKKKRTMGPSDTISRAKFVST